MLHAWLRALAGLQEFTARLDMSNSFTRMPLLTLHWYDALAEQLVARHYAERSGWDVGRASAVVGSPGTGKSMSRNHVAKHILASTDGPVTIVFTTTRMGSHAPDVVVVSREGDRGTRLVFGGPQAAFAARGVADATGGHSWWLTDVSRGELRYAPHSHHVVYFTSNNPRLAVELSQVSKVTGTVAQFWVPQPQLQEAIAWYDLVHDEPASGEMRGRLEQWMLKYGHSLRVVRLLVAAKQGWQACEREMEATMKERLGKARITMEVLVDNDDADLEHMIGDSVFCIKSTFSATNPVFDKEALQWRSKWVKDQVYWWAWAKASYDATCLSSRYNNVAMLDDVRRRLFEDLILAQFRVSNARRSLVFTFFTTMQRGQHTADKLGLTTRDGTVPAPIASAVPHSRCLWFRDIGKWDCHDLCPEVAEIKRVITDGDGSPVLLIPYNPNYPGLDAVLVWRQGREWKALLIQVTLSARHDASPGGQAVMAFWITCLADHGVGPTNIGVLFCPNPEYHPYARQDVGDEDVAQYSMSWATDVHNLNWSAKRPREYSPNLDSIDACLLCNKTAEEVRVAGGRVPASFQALDFVVLVCTEGPLVAQVPQGRPDDFRKPHSRDVPRVEPKTVNCRSYREEV